MLWSFLGFSKIRTVISIFSKVHNTGKPEFTDVVPKSYSACGPLDHVGTAFSKSPTIYPVITQNEEAICVTNKLSSDGEGLSKAIGTEFSGITIIIYTKTGKSKADQIGVAPTSPSVLCYPCPRKNSNASMIFKLRPLIGRRGLE